jgi:hypothetical protein
MRAWEPEKAELKNGGKPWRAFKVYRDMGPGRTLRAAAEVIYGPGVEHGVRTVEGWSSKFDWVERIAAMDARDEMMMNEAIEEAERSKAKEFAERQHRLRERLLENAELAAEQERAMLEYPLTETIRVEGDPEDPAREVTYVIRPAGWNKNTAARMRAIARTSVAPYGSHTPADGEDEGNRQPLKNTRGLRDATDRLLEQLELAAESGTGEGESFGPGPSGDPELGDT